jgi:hypothetical protein
MYQNEKDIIPGISGRRYDISVRLIVVVGGNVRKHLGRREHGQH